tara:strand:- start:465 stop:647 length:183 start_codon:yes stop_codon:yes gene_type:complete
MAEELLKLELTVRQRRIGGLMRENDIKIVRNQQDEATTDSNYIFNIALDWLDHDPFADDI